jgi:hypothetical protein
MSDFEQWFRSLNANGKTVYFLGNEHKVSEMAWNHQQAIIDDLRSQLNNMEACYIGKKKECEGLQGQLKTWKGQSLAAMLHGTCKCGEPWQSIVSDREGFNLLHCFNCNNDRYENKEFFGDHEPKSMRGAND